uniref:Uncharacterized protein n=1 Tax=Candidozyma auris TaxID=498019 RepID=A0A0L0NNK8_CANAR
MEGHPKLCAGSFSLVFDKQKGSERVSVAGARRWLEMLNKNRVDWLLGECNKLYSLDEVCIT